MKKLFCLLLNLCLLACIMGGCRSDSATSSDGSSDTTPLEVDFAQTDSEMMTERDRETEFDTSDAVTIKLNGSSATSSSNSVKISGSNVTITEEATYVISGKLSNGSIIVDADKDAKPQLVLSGADITGKGCAPIYIADADKVFITLADGTSNTLSNEDGFTAIDGDNIDGAIFSKQDLTLNGSGSLTVTSPKGCGIVCKDNLVITGGNYTINSSSHGIDANDSIRIADADITIDTGKDGFHAENSDNASLGFIYISSGNMNIESEGDGISAASYIQLENGDISILSGGGSVNSSKQTSDGWGGFMGGRGMPNTTSSENSTSIKGIKSGGGMLISNGNITIDSADDALHSNSSITINGGTFEIASGDDGVHADETLSVTAGTINITECYEGLEALDVSMLGGTISLVASDDGINAAGGNDESGTGGMRGGDNFGGRGPMGGGGMSSSSNGSVTISGGKLHIKASGDGIDANGTLTISGGHITVCGPTQGDTATLDYDNSAIITGGTFIGTGASGMAQSFSDSKQGVLAVSVGNQSAGTAVTVKDKGGKVLLSYTPELSFAVVIFSSPEITSGTTYSITVGSNSGEIEAE